MGTKRPFDEEFQQFIKHPKHLDHGDKVAWVGENKICHEAPETIGIPGDTGVKLFKFYTSDGQVSESINIALNLAAKEFESSPSLSSETITAGEEVGKSATFCSSFFPEYFELNFPRRQIVPLDEAYSALLNSSPRKEIPLGPSHQADIPNWQPEIVKNETESDFVGVCVISTPNSNYSAENSEDEEKCDCLDGGSIRCVQQHVKESRVKLRETLGHEKFVNLGFEDMGEEVSSRWTEEEELVFHAVIYSNPVSRDRNFWDHLSMAFPLRTKKELVSYYFNVFMLRKRAAQNRSTVLEIDSDDDEWQVEVDYPFGVGVGEDEDLIDVSDEVPIDHGDDLSFEDTDDDSDDLLIGSADMFEEDCEEFGAEEEKCGSLDCHPVMESESVVPEGNNRKCILANGKGEECVGQLDSGCMLEPADDDTYRPTGSTRGYDLLPTCSIIEEIFGTSKKDKIIG